MIIQIHSQNQSIYKLIHENNGSVEITVPEEVDNVTFDSIELKNKRIIEVKTEKSEKKSISM